MLNFEKKATQAQTNNTNAKVFIAELIKCGVRHFCIGSGRRSIVLANAIATNPLAKIYTHYDERSLGFFALGLAKSLNEPVALLVTSASAVANLYPSIVEAKMSHHPLIVLATNRPNELIDTGSNQTIDQTKMFSHFVEHELNFNFSDPSIKKTSFKNVASRLYQLSRLHDVALINASFSEPLLCEAKGFNMTQESTFCYYSNTKKSLTNDALNEIAYKINNAKNPLIIVAESKSDNQVILTLAQKLCAPVFLDPLSNLRNELDHPCHIPFYQQLISNKQTKKRIDPDLVLHFGRRPISKELLNHLTAKNYIHIEESNDRIDPNNLVTDRICLEPNEFCTQVIDKIEQRDNKKALKELKALSLKAKNQFYELIHTYEDIDELYFFYTLMNHPIDEYNLFFGNSMPIRYADTLFFPCSQIANLYANRGCSGIDGNIATALGLHAESQSPSICILGDLTTLYDFNAFMIDHKNNSPILFVVFNNQQGGIFHHLESNLNEHDLEKFVSLKHNMDFKLIAEAFNLQYFCPESRDELENNLICGLNSNSALLEIKVDAKTSAQRYNKLFYKVEKTLVKM